MLITIPKQNHIEGREIKDLDLRIFIPESLRSDPALKFQAVMNEGTPLKETLGLVCLPEGLIRGKLHPKVGGRTYKVLLLISASSTTLTSEFDLVVSKAPAHSREDSERPNIFKQEFSDIDADLPEMPIENLVHEKHNLWQAIDENDEIPIIFDTLDRPLSRAELYYLLGRYATLTIWNADVLEPASELTLLNLDGASDKYHVFDRGSSLVATPKQLYAADRSLGDSLRTAQAMVREVHRRGWTVEMAGYDRMMMAAWVESKRLHDAHGKELKIMHYTPSLRIMDYYDMQVRGRANQLGAPYAIT